MAQLQLLVFSALAFSVLMRTGIYPPEMRLINLDSDWLYRRAAPALLGVMAGGAQAAGEGLRRGLRTAVARIGAYVHHHHGADGVLARTWTTGGMALWVAILLAAYLVLYYA